MRAAPGRRLVLAGLALAWTRGLPAAEAPDDQREAVAWPAMTLLGGETLAAEAWEDTAAVVVFWATWCPFCLLHNARIEQLHRASAGPHLRVLSVALDGDAAAVRHYMTTNGFHFPVVVGRPELRELFTKRKVVPITCLVDRRGRLVQVIPGEMAEDDVLALAALARPAA